MYCPVPVAPALMPHLLEVGAAAVACKPTSMTTVLAPSPGTSLPPTLAQHSLCQCQVCGLLVSRRFNGVHPRCRPEARAAPSGPQPQPAQQQPVGPDLCDVFQARIPVQRHVPKAARSVWAQCLARALANVSACNSLQSWRDLLMLPKAVLRPPRRGGAKRRDAAAQHTIRRCRRWLEGEREELWETHPARHPRPAGDEKVAARQARCKLLAAEGELSCACSALLSPPLLNPADEGVLPKLRAKHPHSQPALPALVPLGPPVQSQVPDLSTADVISAARSFWRGSAAGPSGLRGDHLREALGTPHCDEVAAHLGDVVRLLASGAALASTAASCVGLDPAYDTARAVPGTRPRSSSRQAQQGSIPIASAAWGRCMVTRPTK